MPRHFNSHVWKDKVCITLNILAKSFLLPASQKQRGKQNPKLSAYPDGAVSPKLHLLSEALCGFSEKKMGLYQDRPLELTVLLFIYFLQGRKQMGYQWVYLCLIQGIVCTMGMCLEPCLGKGNEGRSSQGHMEEGTPPCTVNPKQNRTASEIDGFNQVFFENYQCVKIHRKQTGLQVMLKPKLHGMQAVSSAK